MFTLPRSHLPVLALIIITAVLLAGLPIDRFQWVSVRAQYSEVPPGTLPGGSIVEKPVPAFAIPDPCLVAAGVLDIVDIQAFDPNGQPIRNFNRLVKVCFKGKGRLAYINTSLTPLPRATLIGSFVECRAGCDQTCGYIPDPGIVALIEGQLCGSAAPR